MNSIIIQFLLITFLCFGNFHKILIFIFSIIPFSIASGTRIRGNHVRHKRQATQNCTLLKSQLKKLQDQIIIVQQNITDNTKTMNLLKDKVITFEIKVSTTTGSLKELNLKLLNSYKSLVNSTSIKNINLLAQLNNFKSQESQVQSNIEKYCTITTTTPPPTMVTVPIDLSQVKDLCGNFLIKISILKYLKYDL